jgi:DNA-binding Lrp family transcriptional regulator
MVDKMDVRRRALELIASDGQGVARRLGDELKISRQAANRYLQELVESGLAKATGRTQARRYSLATLYEDRRTFPRKGLDEDVVWMAMIAPAVADLPENVRDIWRYGVTEMVNNAVDHSESVSVHAGLRKTALHMDGWVADDGVGIFHKIQRALGLYDPREAILELAKGKLTTDPARHTGEGVFFTSKAFDEYAIRSGNLTFLHGEDPFDALAAPPQPERGTLVLMRLRNDSSRRLNGVFAAFAPPEEYTFAKTIVPVRLAQYEGEKLVSRSQARRVAMRFERFRHVVLDFSGVVEIGQAFADELFRVFATEHPSVALVPVNMTPEVERMVRRARAAAQEQGQG